MKSLKIFKYNKQLQKRLDININDYKKYSELIEIELIPLQNESGKFININENEKEYFHIYINDSKKEIENYYFNKDEDIKKINIIIDYQIKSFKKLFYDCECIKVISFKQFSRSNITCMNGMFSRCSSLKELNLYNFNTNNVTSMEGMFYGCSIELIKKIKTQYKNIPMINPNIFLL